MFILRDQSNTTYARCLASANVDADTMMLYVYLSRIRVGEVIVSEKTSVRTWGRNRGIEKIIGD